MHRAVPFNEDARLAALQSCDILDTETEHAFDRLTRLARLALEVPIVLISLVDRDRQWLKSAQGVPRGEIARELSFCTHAIQHVEPYVVPDATRDALFYDNPFVTGEPHLRAYVGIPLRTAEGHAIGTLCAMDVQPRYFSDEEIDVLQDLASMVTETIELRRLAATDSLTGAFTRRGVDQEMDREFARARRFGKDLHLVALDIDHFKAVNDRYGHTIGDVVLQSLVTTIRAETRSADLLARMGGEEFVLALPDTDRIGALIVAERLRKRIAETPIDAQGRLVWITASFGVASCDLKQATWTDTLERADIALYRAKRSGRNLAVCYDDLPGIVAA